MTNKINKRLKEIDIILPKINNPIANYLPYILVGNLAFVSGQLPLKNKKILHVGKVGLNVDIKDAIYLARICTINILSVLKLACDGDLDKINRIVKISGFIACTDKFSEHSRVLNGASDLLIEIFGESGRHSRTAIGCNSLPLNSPIELEAIVELKT